MTLIKVAPPLPQEVDLTTTYDAVQRLLERAIMRAA